MKVLNYGSLFSDKEINNLLQFSNPITDIYIFKTKEQMKNHYMKNLEFLKAIYYYYYEEIYVGGVFEHSKIKKPRISIFEYNLYNYTNCKDIGTTKLLFANSLYHEIKHSHQYNAQGKNFNKNSLNNEIEAFEYARDIINTNKEAIEKILNTKFDAIDINTDLLKQYYK